MVNQGADLPLALAKNKGLPGLAGAKITPIIVDHQGKPEVGQSETLDRLVSRDFIMSSKMASSFGSSCLACRNIRWSCPPSSGDSISSPTRYATETPK
jgi:hypothetical protein